MSVTATFYCAGCGDSADSTRRMEPSDTAETVTPDGWVAFDPWTGVTYCPACWAEVSTDKAER